MSLVRLPPRWLAGLAGGLLAALASAGEPCRVAFDMGSSGIRAGASDSPATARADIDYLAPLQAGRGLEETVAPTIAALRDLPLQAGFSARCVQVGGGFSAWRLAAQQDAAGLAATLRRIRQASGVAVLVIPQAREGAYGYAGARKVLGDRLITSHVLDIGGGSLQIAGARSSFGDALGQKAWHGELCRRLRPGEPASCPLQPLSPTELATARGLLAERLRPATRLPRPVTMTAISRPVSRGILPALERLALPGADPRGFSLAAASAAIDRLAGLDLDDMSTRVGAPPAHAAYLLSDLLLVEGLLLATGGDSLQVAETDLTNLPGLLADDRAFAWHRHYGCYLRRLQRQGPATYDSDPASCR